MLPSTFADPSFAELAAAAGDTATWDPITLHRVSLLERNRFVRGLLRSLPPTTLGEAVLRKLLRGERIQSTFMGCA